MTVMGQGLNEWMPMGVDWPTTHMPCTCCYCRSKQSYTWTQTTIPTNWFGHQVSDADVERIAQRLKELLK